MIDEENNQWSQERLKMEYVVKSSPVDHDSQVMINSSATKALFKKTNPTESNTISHADQKGLNLSLDQVYQSNKQFDEEKRQLMEEMQNMESLHENMQEEANNEMGT